MRHLGRKMVRHLGNGVFIWWREICSPRKFKRVLKLRILRELRLRGFGGLVSSELFERFFYHFFGAVFAAFQ